MILKIFLKKWMKYILRMINKCWICLGLVFEKKVNIYNNSFVLILDLSLKSKFLFWYY